MASAKRRVTDAFFRGQNATPNFVQIDTGNESQAAQWISLPKQILTDIYIQNTPRLRMQFHFGLQENLAQYAQLDLESRIDPDEVGATSMWSSSRGWLGHTLAINYIIR